MDGELLEKNYMILSKSIVIIDNSKLSYAGKDINKIDQIIKGEDITQEKLFSKSYATTSFLMDDKLSNLNQFSELLKKLIQK